MYIELSFVLPLAVAVMFLIRDYESLKVSHESLPNPHSEFPLAPRHFETRRLFKRPKRHGFP